MTNDCAPPEAELVTDTVVGPTMNMGQTTASFKRLMWGYAFFTGGAMVLVLIGLLCIHLFGSVSDAQLAQLSSFIFDGQFLIFLTVGFIAQLVDGSLGMAYGITSTSFLMSAGVSPAVASAAVHISEVFTSAVSGVSHWRFGNVNMPLFKRLALPGMLGAALGALLLSHIDPDIIRPIVAVYLILMGGVVLRKAFSKRVEVKTPPKRVSALALLGGFVDASGGGGWGPVVSSTLIGSGNNPRTSIGTVSAAEFLVAVTASGVFTMFLGIDNWQVVLGLIVGGALAAPMGAYICNRINVRAAMVLVGLLIIFLSGRTILKATGIW